MAAFEVPTPETGRLRFPQYTIGEAQGVTLLREPRRSQVPPPPSCEVVATRAAVLERARAAVAAAAAEMEGGGVGCDNHDRLR